uniref:Uncharacterized protein n=1 Tax=Glossina austeni TaxID=7395 RepID=A0A1A9UNM5_GLOAU
MQADIVDVQSFRTKINAGGDKHNHDSVRNKNSSNSYQCFNLRKNKQFIAAGSGDTNNDDDNDNDNDNGDDDDDIDTLTATAGTTIMLQVSVSAQKASPNMTSISTANAPHTHHA